MSKIPVASAEIVAKPESQTKVAKPKSQYPGYTEARRKANKEWAKKQAQIAIRISPEVKAAIDQHISQTNESIATFIVRAAKEQIKRDQD